MKKKSIAARLGVAALALTLITTSLSSGTLAKYTSKDTVDASLLVAKWNVAASVVKEDKKEVTLTSDAFTLADIMRAREDGTISTGKIAPGTEGYFAVLVDTSAVDIDSNTQVATEVAVDYKVSVKMDSTAGNAAPPTNFYMTQTDRAGTDASPTYDDSKYSKLTFTEAGASAEKELATGTVEAGELGDSAKKYVWIHWAWPYETTDNGSTLETNDNADTTNGVRAATTKFRFTITMTQHNPEEPIGA